MRNALLLLLLVVGAPVPRAEASLAPPFPAWAQARRRVETAWSAVQAPAARTEESEARGAAVLEAGYDAFGPSFNRTEAAAILALMGDWLRAPREAPDADALLVEAAKAAHPQIGEGRAMRSARNWAKFVDALSETP